MVLAIKSLVSRPLLIHDKFASVKNKNKKIKIKIERPTQKFNFSTGGQTNNIFLGLIYPPTLEIPVVGEIPDNRF